MLSSTSSRRAPATPMPAHPKPSSPLVLPSRLRCRRCWRHCLPSISLARHSSEDASGAVVLGWQGSVLHEAAGAQLPRGLPKLRDGAPFGGRFQEGHLRQVRYPACWLCKPALTLVLMLVRRACQQPLRPAWRVMGRRGRRDLPAVQGWIIRQRRDDQPRRWLVAGLKTLSSAHFRTPHAALSKRQCGRKRIIDMHSFTQT